VPLMKDVLYAKDYPPPYTDVLLTDQYGNVGAGQYLGHGCFWHPNYPVLGQAVIKSWEPLPEKGD
jgi:hypothetical protein